MKYSKLQATIKNALLSCEPIKTAFKPLFDKKKDFVNSNTFKSRLSPIQNNNNCL